jgi:hypothetical protein
MTRTLAAAALLALVGPAVAADYTVKVEDTPPPKELAEPVRALLDSKAMTVADAKGKAILTVWPRKSLEPKAGAELSYASLEESAVLGAVKVPEVWKDYRRQNIKPGVYTLRLGNQPMDGDHMGTAPYSEFCVLSPAEEDKKPDLMEAKALNELSSKTTDGHPGVLVMFPGKGATAKPTLSEKDEGHWVLLIRLDAKAGATKATMDLGLNLVGVSSSA